MSTIIISGIVALVILYMMYPRFLRRRMSSARFFSELPPPRKGQSRLRRGKLELTLPFFLQLFVLLLLLAAVSYPDKKFKGEEAAGIGVWFLIDTSASMSTLQENETRQAAAVREVDAVIDQARSAAKSRELCFRLSAFDLERRDIVVGGDAPGIRQAVRNLNPRPLGTDLGLIRGVMQLLKAGTNTREQCRVSHIVVVTDMPAPAWLWESESCQVVWRDVGKPAANVGFTGISAARNPLTGLASEVIIEVTAYGPIPAETRLSVTAPDGTVVKDEILDWRQDRYWQGSFAPVGAGQYKLKLSPGGAYAFDDTAEISLDEGREIRVDWRLPDRRIPGQMGWKEDKIAPHLGVTSDMSTHMEIPTLIVGPGYGNRRTGAGETGSLFIRDFIETSPLLADINLDAVESLGMRGLELPDGFKPVLRGMDGTVWLAEAENPLRAFVPGLPTGTDDTLGRFSAAVFFNAVRWLLQKRDIEPLYTLTSPYAPEPAGSRLVLHKDEGNTWRTPGTPGELTDLKPLAGKGATIPLWPILLMAAIILFSIERAVTLYRR